MQHSEHELMVQEADGTQANRHHLRTFVVANAHQEQLAPNHHCGAGARRILETGWKKKLRIQSMHDDTNRDHVRTLKNHHQNHVKSIHVHIRQKTARFIAFLNREL